MISMACTDEEWAALPPSLPPFLPPALTSSKPFFLLFTTAGPFESTQNRSLGGRGRREGGREGGRALRKARSKAENSEYRRLTTHDLACSSYEGGREGGRKGGREGMDEERKRRRDNEAIKVDRGTGRREGGREGGRGNTYLKAPIALDQVFSIGAATTGRADKARIEHLEGEQSFL